MFKKLLNDYFAKSRSEQRASTVIIILFFALLSYRIYHASLPVREMASHEIISPPAEICYPTFDPNTVLADTLKVFGLSDYLIDRFIKYRDNYGPINSKDKLCSLYGLSDTLCELLNQYALYPMKDIKKRTYKPSSLTTVPETETKKRYAKPFQIESKTISLNTSDTSDLKSLPGIGSVYSKRIVKYRDLLGGFHKSEQLLEVYGLDSVKYEKIAPYLEVDPIQINAIELLTCSLFQLKKHPYFSNPLARAIVRFRDQHPDISTVEELKQMHIMNDSIFGRIRPYLYIEQQRTDEF